MADDPREIYLDANASEPLRPEAAEAVARVLTLRLGNPSSGHAAGRRARAVLSDAREAVADLVGAKPMEIVLTSGATEANVLALRGLLAADAARADRGARPSGVALTRAEHPSLVRLAERLAAEGTDVRFGPVGRGGLVDPAALAAIAPERGVVCLGAAQSVTGAVQDVRAVSDLSRAAARECRVHCDATQAVGRVHVSTAILGAATLSLSGHKFGAPAGIGALVIAEHTPWRPPNGDGSQEMGRRPGTEAVVLAAGLAAAARVAARDLHARALRDAAHRDSLITGLHALGGTLLTPHDDAARDVLSNTALVVFPGCPGDALLAALDADGVRVSVGTACTSLARTPPEVLIAAGVPPVVAASAIRVSLPWSTIPGDIEALLASLATAVPRVRRAFADRTSRLDVS